MWRVGWDRRGTVDSYLVSLAVDPVAVAVAVGSAVGPVEPVVVAAAVVEPVVVAVAAVAEPFETAEAALGSVQTAAVGGGASWQS